jgi:hypothetical protein
MLLGPLLGFAIFIAISHAAEIRYLYPSLLLLFACSAIVVDKLRAWWLTAVASIALLLLSIWGTFNAKDFVYKFSGYGAIAAILGTALWTCLRQLHRSRPRAWIIPTAIAVIALIAAVYVYWPAYIEELRRGAENARATTAGRKPLSELWQWVDDNVPPDATIAYTNLFMVHPLYGSDYCRTVFYAPTRSGIHAYHDLPPSRTKLTDQQIRAWCAEQLTKNADRETWMKNLDARKPQYVVIGKQDVLESPPERKWADKNARAFEKVFENSAGTLYRVKL